MTIQNGYATLTDVKAALRMGAADTTDDTLLEAAIESASRMIDDDCDRVFFASGTGVTRYFAAREDDYCPTDDLISISAVAIDYDGDGVYETSIESTSYRTDPPNNIAGGRAWPTTGLVAIDGQGFYFPVDDEDDLLVAVTGNYGFASAVPAEIKQACIIQSLRNFKRLDSPLGVAGFGDMGAVRVSRTDPDVFASIRRYKRFGGIGVA